ncbi:TPA: DDE-type integrase/transposase/recombinase [Legionella anisa]
MKYLNNMVEQDHRGIKNITKYKLGFKSFQAAKQKLQELNYIE